VAALLAWWPLSGLLPWTWLGGVLLVTCLAGIWICGRTTQELGVDDHVGVVWDEVVSVWIVLWAMPPVAWAWLLGFVLFRVFDIVKPWPIKQLDERVAGGLGVMLDDWVAAVYAIMVVWASAWVFVVLINDGGL
jgi:phosphatidylglycerophosphatase A